MSLQVVCAQCGDQCGYYNGSKIFPSDDNDTINHFAMSKVKGEMGCTWNESTLTDTVFICRKCYKTLLPNAYKLYLEQCVIPERKFTNEEAEKLLNVLFPALPKSALKKVPVQHKVRETVSRHRRGRGYRRSQTN